jgi:hypothetical protein
MNNQLRTARKDKARTDSQDRQPGPKGQDRTAKTGQPGQDSQDRTAKTGQPRKDSQDRTTMTRC